jgi:hypothetical protein
MGESADRYFFVRPQRTASTTLRLRMARLFGDAGIYPNGSDYRPTDPYGEAAVSIDRLVERMTVRGDEIRVVAGHFPLCVVGLLGGRFRTFMVLRDPVERTLSSLRHRRREPLKDRDKSLEEIYDKPFRSRGFWGRNHMTKILSLSVEEARDIALNGVDVTAARLERAKENLRSLDLVGVQERFEEFCNDLNEQFGWSLGDEPRWENPSAPIGVSEAFRARIAEDNAADIELYQLALRLVEERSVARRLAT